MFKRIVLWLHKWLGIITGLVVLVVSLTGTIYTFQDELKLCFYPNKYFLDKSKAYDTTHVPLSTLIQKANSSLPQGEKVSRIDLYPAKDRTWVFRATETDEKAFGYNNYFKYNKRVFLNPYTGEVVAIEDSKSEFFQIVLQLHMNLLLGKKYGHPIVGYSTLVFAVLLLSGIVLWWPKKRKKKTLKRSFWISAKSKWKRLNHDMHNVLGFYACGIALVLCVTGMVFSFPGFRKGYTHFFNSISLAKKVKSNEPKAYAAIPALNRDPLDNMIVYGLKKYPTAEMISFRLRAVENPEVDMQIRMHEKRSGIFKWYYVQKDNLKINTVKANEQLQGGDRLASLNYDLHTGNIGGWPLKVLYCLVSLCCASLPVTGYIIWWNKSRSKRNDLQRSAKAIRESIF